MYVYTPIYMCVYTFLLIFRNTVLSKIESYYFSGEAE